MNMQHIISELQIGGIEAGYPARLEQAEIGRELGGCDTLIHNWRETF